MKIKEVQIKNFRSIENISIDFKENPRVLVGINESGKTNILEAIRLISQEFSIQKDDIRIPEKGIIGESKILFVFKFEKNELEEIYQKTKEKILLEDDSKLIAETNNEKLNLKDFIQKFYNEGLYKIDIKNNTRIATRWKLNEKAKFICNFKKPKSGANFTFQNKKGETLNISNFDLIDLDSYSQISPEYLEQATVEILDKIIGDVIIGAVSKNLPKVIYWKYDEANLLPPSVSISAFAANTSSCVPLKNMFILADIPENEIGREITEARQRSQNDFRTLLRQVSIATTKYFKDAWPEYKNIRFSLNPNGENIDCGIDEKTIQDFKRRSDGFKRFITILLLLSIPAKKDLLKNTLILIDEADQSLHPSGCRYLMQQLIKIAQNNYVMYSTHSIFMIDKENIERHYIVEKKKEITTTKEASEENYRDEEVIYKAFGISTFEILEEKNILFEGWTDKKLFETAMKKGKNIAKFFEKIGRSHAIGVKSIKNITPILEWSQRKIFIISDGDQVSQQEQKEFIDNKGYGIWKRYDELFNQRKIFTAEDFIKKEILKKVLDIKSKEFNINFDQNFQLPETKRIKYIKEQLIKKNIVGDSLKEFIEGFKQNLFRNLKLDDIEDDYFDFIQLLKEEISKL
jgi:predicted ATP-dependent endonuclease of OLD family